MNRTLFDEIVRINWENEANEEHGENVTTSVTMLAETGNASTEEIENEKTKRSGDLPTNGENENELKKRK